MTTTHVPGITTKKRLTGDFTQKKKIIVTNARATVVEMKIVEQLNVESPRMLEYLHIARGGKLGNAESYPNLMAAPRHVEKVRSLNI